eukprot:CAMPEP_0197340280 /NCGR_PEP_ID=MMETSP0892-20130614/45562_1 /TAXON_ID=44058 ORGANISM="Aureoumbra lagunensis, Strain CCMP1510" /NCGR_SAMPLE_ID=MMETSP0892 /ASSEMBLY_ACC=CAM_ASM_000538 /LENGTH=30 /DNA_ID= /DNA_START= /DNA_END= /DNA_ORIENTATION=
MIKDDDDFETNIDSGKGPGHISQMLSLKII